MKKKRIGYHRYCQIKEGYGPPYLDLNDCRCEEVAKLLKNICEKCREVDGFWHCDGHCPIAKELKIRQEREG
jgi:hypothetical protein